MLRILTSHSFCMCVCESENEFVCITEPYPDTFMLITHYIKIALFYINIQCGKSLCKITVAVFYVCAPYNNFHAYIMFL